MSSSNSFIAAAVQLRPQDSLSQNLAAAAVLIEQSADAGSQLVVLPENFAYLGRKDLAEVGLAERSKGPVYEFLAEQACRHSLWLVGGTVPVTDPDSSKPFARSWLFDPQGNLVQSYDKIHLFDVDVAKSVGRTLEQVSYRESDDYLSAKDVVVAQAGACRLGMSVCYDLRFPELYRQLADADAQVVVVPAAFTAATGRDHWELLLRARAVENQLFVIGANMVDREHPRRGLWGGSAIIDPWGTVLARVDDKPGVAIAEIDLDRLTEIRGKMPVAQHRKL
jgi:predicted amidohydrolase|tara:strand:+ start:2046 stop:2885 length:840 start_codon:yes stop_codon:yes gene_type:complete